MRASVTERTLERARLVPLTPPQSLLSLVLYLKTPESNLRTSVTERTLERARVVPLTPPQSLLSLVLYLKTPESNLRASVTERTLERAIVVSRPHHNLFYLWFIPENAGVELARLSDREYARAR